MKRDHTVIWSETAETDLLTIIEYLADDSPFRVYDIFKELRRKASGLKSFPERGRVVPELAGQGIAQYHELVVEPWRIIYRISEKRVDVLSMLDSRRSVEDVLLRRLIGLKL